MSVKTTFTCYADYLQRCTPFPIQAMQTQVRANLALFDVCDRPDLFPKFQIFSECADKLDKQGNTSAGGGFRTCVHAIPNILESPGLTSLMQQYFFTVIFNNQTGVDGAEVAEAASAQEFIGTLKERWCCALNKLGNCGLQAASQACSADAVSVVQTIVTAVLGANNCTQLQDTTNCGL